MGNGNNNSSVVSANYINIENLSVFYEDKEVLKDVHLTVYSDDFIGVIGPNGGGKTTLVKAILGLVPYCGKVTFAPEIMENGKPKIGYLPQLNEFDNAFPLSILDVVASGLQRQGRIKFGKKDYELATRLLEKIGIAHIAAKPVGSVSGGEMQRALLCRAIISEPKLLILDEPANFVDNKFEKELYEILKELNKEMAIIMVSHDIGTITTVVKNIVCVNRCVHRHESNHITPEQLKNYDCPIQVITHGEVPHTVLEAHN